MNRRDFTKSLAAIGLAPALPTLPAAAAGAAPAYTPYMYGLGAHMARTLGHSSPAMLMAKLHLSPVAAQAMQAQLTRAGIVGAAGASGLAGAARPYMATGPSATSALADTARKITRKLAEDVLNSDAPPQDHGEDPPRT